MNFFITCYIYPLRSEVILSQELGFYFDNPRNPDDIRYVKAYWEEAYAHVKNNKAFSLHTNQEPSFFVFSPVLKAFQDKFARIDPYVSEAFEQYREEDFFDFLAQITVLAFFDDSGETSKIREDLNSLRANGEDNVFALLSDDHPLEINANRLLAYSDLLSILSHTEKDAYNGLSFVLDDERMGQSQPPFYVIINYFLFGRSVMLYGEVEPGDTDGERTWMFWPNAKEKLIEIGKLLDAVVRKGFGDKLLYIGNILRLAHHSSDTKVRVVMLTSVIELLLTHNPQADRFNVDDSINKQFQLKAAILIYLNDKRRDINAIRKRLRLIYQQRSNIAHGNFAEFDKFIRGLSKKEGSEEYFDDLVSDLYVYSRAILEEYIKDSVFVDFLKNG